ncbi:hypothetical protein ACRJ4W_48390 [Streptomyces sp. GLT-R25]
MDTLRSRAEILKLARLLDVEPRQLAFLEELPAEDVRAFRERSVAALFDDAPGTLDRIAAKTKLLPAGIAAGISQKALGPQLAAALAGRLEPGRAADIIERLPPEFTARCCHHVDPRRIAGIMGRLDDDIVVRIALVLADRRDHLTMGRFVGHLRDSALLRILAAARRHDPAAHRLRHRPSRTARPHRRAAGRGAADVGHRVRRRPRAVAGGHGRREHGLR